MQGLLVIEQSSTLSNLLVRTLGAGGYSLTCLSRDFAQATSLLEKSAGDKNPYDAVVLGVPPREANAIKPVLKLLQDEAARGVPLLLVTHDRHPLLERWSAKRGMTETIAWQSFSKIPGVLGQMLPDGLSTDAPAGAGAPRPVRVLFVDDSHSARYAYRQLLEANGFPVQVAATVTEAQEKAADEDFELIIVDYYLPDGTGDQLCRHLRESPKSRNSTLAIITGGYRESIIKKCLDAGAIECMFKNEAKELFVTRVATLARDIESRLIVEAERERVEGILASVDDGVYGVDSGGRLTFINQTGLNMLGYQAGAELIGELAADKLHYRIEEDPDPSPGTNLADHYGGSEPQTALETVFCHRTGKPVPVQCSTFPLSLAAREETVVVFRDISERKSSEQLRWELSHDPVTGLANRRHFTQSLDKALKRLDSSGGYDALLCIDIDRFDEIVDSVGRDEGDRLLSEIGSRLAKRLREPDSLARLDGDKFALLLTGIQLHNLFTIADEFRSALAESHFDYHGSQRPVAGAIGVVVLTSQTPSAEYALEHARLACENAKKKGRNQTHIYVSEDDSRTARELESGWEERFKDAVSKDRFVFLAQPIIPSDCLPGTVEVGSPDAGIPRLARADGRDELIFELLLRMVSSDGQWISPSVFVPLAERVNMVQEVDLWVVQKAVARLKRLEHSEYNVCLTINISNVTLQDREALRQIRDVILSHPIDPSRLIFEVTETAEIASLANARKFMVELKKLGCRFALDDFGSGFSSFSHLKHLPVHFIKIDGPFVQAMVSNSVDRTMVSSMIDMAHALGLGTIAEHVNSSPTLEAVRQAQVDYVQGNFLGEPILIDNLDIEGLFGKQMRSLSS